MFDVLASTASAIRLNIMESEAFDMISRISGPRPGIGSDMLATICADHISQIFGMMIHRNVSFLLSTEYGLGINCPRQVVAL
jgi:hypothetical protein